MNVKDYDLLSAKLAQYAQDIQTSKRPGYTRGNVDILKNFKDVAARAGLTPGQAWAVYFLKHIDAITSIMTQPGLPVSEAPRGRFADAINYLYLGYALFEEHQDKGPTNKSITVDEVLAQSAEKRRPSEFAGRPAPVNFDWPPVDVILGPVKKRVFGEDEDD